MRVVPLERIPRPRFEVVRRVAGVGTAPPLSAIIIAGTAAALFLPLFFVPALPVRYGLLGWGTAYAAAAAALVLVTAAAVRGIAGTFARRPVSRVRWLVQMAITVAAGLAVGTAASRLLRDGYPESRLLWAAAAFFLGATVTCALIDSRTRPRSLPGRWPGTRWPGRCGRVPPPAGRRTGSPGPARRHAGCWPGRPGSRRGTPRRGR